MQVNEEIIFALRSIGMAKYVRNSESFFKKLVIHGIFFILIRSLQTYKQSYVTNKCEK